MEIEQISNAWYFKVYIFDMIQRYSLTDRSMEEYLRALWGEIQRHRKDPVTYTLLARMLENAYTSDPVPYDPGWKEVRRMGWTWDRKLKAYIIKVFDRETGQWIIKDRGIDPFEILKTTILQQITERYLLEHAENELSTKEREKLINNWSNPEPFTFNSAGVIALCSDMDTQDDPQPDKSLSWADLAAYLSIGQVYD